MDTWAGPVTHPDMEADWRERAGELGTVPNLISLSRLPLLVLVVVFLESPLRYPLFALIVLTDGVDGWVARRLDQTTELGAMLDPALDKLTALALFAVLFPRTGLALEYLVLFFARDIAVVSFGLLLPLIDLPNTGTIKARPLGKAVTNLQFFAMVAMLVPHVFATEALLWALGVASTLAIADYVIFFGRKLSDRPWVQDRRGAVVTYVGVGVVFAVVVATLLLAELRSFLDSLPV